MTGTVKRKTDKGFGFIAGDDGKEYFFHHSSLSRGGFDNLREGAKVRFDPTTGPKGARAEDVVEI